MIIYDLLIDRIKTAFYENKFGKKLESDRVQWDPNWDLSVKPLLDILGVNLMCCRNVMLGK
jgi:DNA-directed RNA polymerase subunit N (RpoN/RPB10)